MNKWCPGPYARWGKTSDGDCFHYYPANKKNPTTKKAKTTTKIKKITYPEHLYTKKGILRKDRASLKEISVIRKGGKVPKKTKKKSTTKNTELKGLALYKKMFFTKENNLTKNLPSGLSSVRYNRKADRYELRSR